jgi:hypothetical protein
MPAKPTGRAVARLGRSEYFAVGNSAVAHIPRAFGKGHHAIELRRNPDRFDTKRPWLARLNSSPTFAIATHRLFRRKRFQNVLKTRINGLRGEIQLILDVNDLPHQPVWCIIIERLVAMLTGGGGA